MIQFNIVYVINDRCPSQVKKIRQWYMTRNEQTDRLDLAVENWGSGLQ